MSARPVRAGSAQGAGLPTVAEANASAATEMIAATPAAANNNVNRLTLLFASPGNSNSRRFGRLGHRRYSVQQLSLFPSVLSSDRITYLIDRRTLLRQLLRHQRLTDADFALRAVVASITIEQILMAVHPVTTAIAMQLRKQRRTLLRNLVGLLCRPNELVGIECHAFGRLIERDRIYPSRAATMTRDAHSGTRTAIFHR